MSLQEKILRIILQVPSLATEEIFFLENPMPAIPVNPSVKNLYPGGRYVWCELYIQVEAKCNNSLKIPRKRDFSLSSFHVHFFTEDWILVCYFYHYRQHNRFRGIYEACFDGGSDWLTPMVNRSMGHCRYFFIVRCYNLCGTRCHDPRNGWTICLL